MVLCDVIYSSIHTSALLNTLHLLDDTVHKQWNPTGTSKKQTNERAHALSRKIIGALLLN